MPILKSYANFFTMIVRIVRMHIASDQVDEFVDIFNRTKDAIRNVEGCSHLELFQDVDDPNTFITYSHWSDTASLDAYRKTELFKNVWQRVKTLFTAPAEAFSMEKYTELI